MNYFHYSLKSGNETCFWLDILIDSGKCDKNTGQNLLKEARELANILAASVITMKTKG
ncbi:four helix bundle protein [candidate division TA06 bacterium]|uniref:Four helix bundle protein n=1 Tax=candidate division TA06 bacterium TaxID=2250710 RepID=A0A933I6Z6_UNCT6|nr:four helix bundle protein [candidate division TA06 bacterium]